AMEGTLLGVPSLAISLLGRSGFRFEAAARFSARLATWVVERGLPPDTLLNVNVPALANGASDGDGGRGFALTRMGRRRYGDAIGEPGDPARNQEHGTGEQ